MAADWRRHSADWQRIGELDGHSADWPKKVGLLKKQTLDFCFCLESDFILVEHTIPKFVQCFVQNTINICTNKQRVTPKVQHSRRSGSGLADTPDGVAVDWRTLQTEWQRIGGHSRRSGSGLADTPHGVPADWRTLHTEFRRIGGHSRRSASGTLQTKLKPWVLKIF